MSLTVEGHPLGWRLPTAAVAIGAAVVALVSVVQLSVLDLPWMLPKDVLTTEPIVPASVVVFVLFATRSLAKAFFLRRTGRAELGELGVVFTRRGFRRAKVAWSDLAAYCDASRAWVDLILRGESSPRASLSIPTRDEEARVAVLALLDGHGLRRVEVAPRGRRLGRALLAGAVWLLVFHGLVYAANARWRQFRALKAGELSTADAAALVSRSVPVRARFRPVVGTEDNLCIEARPGIGGVPGFFVAERAASLSLSTAVTLGGTTAAEIGGGFGLKIGGVESLLAALDGDHYCQRLVVSPARLGPGRHELRVVHRIQLDGGSCEKETVAAVEVVPGSCAGSVVKLVPGVRAEITVKPSWSGGQWNLWAEYGPCARPLAMLVEVTEGETLLVATHLVAQAKGQGGQSLAHGMTPRSRTTKLASGRHVLKVRFTPSAKVAFEGDVDMTEIAGEVVELEVVLDVP